MKLLIELPTWLGDCVMATGSIEKLLEQLNPKEVIVFGSFVSTSLYKNHPKVTKIVIDNTKKGNRILNVLKVSKELKSDIGITFRNHFFSKFLMFLSCKKFYYQKKDYQGHQVEKYNKFIDDVLGMNLNIYFPKLYFTPFKYQKPTIGINPGATYGSAKRWYPEEFAKVANELGKKYNIIIFGGPGEEEIANDIEKNLTITNYQNLCGKLTIQELCEKIGGLELLITNDSGPMHIGAAFGVKIVALFGPTKYNETSPYNTEYKIVTKNLECSPCMKRECPLKHHECMKLIRADEVIKASKEVLCLKEY